MKTGELQLMETQRVGHDLAPEQQQSQHYDFGIMLLTQFKKAEHRRIDAFELWCWRRLESPLDCKEIQPVHPKGDQP